MELMQTFSVAKSIFIKRSVLRRIEFRRIKKQYELLANVHPFRDTDAANLKDPTKFLIKTYNDHSLESEMPPFLIDPNFYFNKQGLSEITDKQCEKVSDSEMPNF